MLTIEMKYLFGDGFSGPGASAALYGENDSGTFVQKGKLQFQQKSTIADSVRSDKPRNVIHNELKISQL